MAWCLLHCMYDAEKLHKWTEWARQVPYVYTASVLCNDDQHPASFVNTRTPAPKEYQVGGHNRKSTTAKKRLSEVCTLDKSAEKRIRPADLCGSATEQPWVSKGVSATSRNPGRR